MAVNYRQIKAIEKKNKERVLKLHPSVPETSGIYIFYRRENGFKYAYVGQAKHLLTRLAQHLSGYQHIDLSIKRHGLWSADNPCGWNVRIKECAEHELNELEQFYIQWCANEGYQLRNKTTGSQGEGKRALDDYKSPKGYREGLRQGYLNAQRYVANLFDKHLVYGKRSDKPNKIQEKALAKFEDFLRWQDDNEEE
jgi:hypothetical protein